MLRQGEGNKSFQSKKVKPLEDDEDITISEGLSDKYDTSKIKELKDSMKKTAVELLQNLDVKHQKLRKSYDSCYDQKCADMNKMLMGS